MLSSFLHLARKPRQLEWLMLIPLTAFFVATQIVMNEEGRIFADPSRHVSNASHAVPIELKGQTFYVSQRNMETHDLAERVSFGTMALVLVGIVVGRRLRRDGRRP